MGIVVIGDVFIDIKGYSIASYIPQGRNVGTIAQIHGGVGRNVAEDIANLELKPTFISLVNDDAMGEEVIRKLERHKVDTSYMRKVPNGMGTWMAIFDNNGDVVALFPRDQITHRWNIFWMSVEMRFLRTQTALRQRLIQTEKSLRKPLRMQRNIIRKYMQWYPI